MAALTPTSADAQLLSWLSSKGASFPKIQFPALHPTKMYRCALATEAIESGEHMVRVPYECMVCAPTCLASPGDALGAVLRDLWQGKLLSGDPLLAVCMCREVVKGEESEFHPYFRFLLEGEPPGTIQRWGEAELAELQNKAMGGRVRSRNEDEENMHRRAVRVVTAHAENMEREFNSVDAEEVRKQLTQITLPL
jgi:hypothetical protein